MYTVKEIKSKIVRKINRLNQEISEHISDIDTHVVLDINFDIGAPDFQLGELHMCKQFLKLLDNIEGENYDPNR